MPKYQATRLIRHGDAKGKMLDISEGATVVFSEEEAQPLLECGALVAIEAAGKAAEK